MFTAVDAYDRYVGRYSPLLAEQLVAMVGIRPGQSALDVGCGPGALTASLVAMLGPENVTAVDPSAAFVEACRQRHPGARVEVAAAESLPFSNAQFDAALAQLVVNFMTDAVAGVTEMRRVTGPGGVVAAAVWDYGDGMTLIRTFWDAVSATSMGRPYRDEQQMRYATPTELRDLWDLVGLRDVSVNGATVAAEYDDFEDLWAPLEAGVGPAGAYSVALSVEGRRALKMELARRLDVSSQPFQLSARAWVVTGRVP
jgi:SAM-dependent methyltransferase